MASLNKQSVREEFEKIKANFDELVKAGKVSSEIAVLFNALIMLVSIILSVFMEKLTKKDSRNSSRPHVAFTNNRAERDLRMTKVKQKISGCFRTEKYAQAYCRISSYLQTMNNKGVNPLVAVSWALSGRFDV